MYGYATDETESYMPAPISYAHKLSRRLTEVRNEGTLDYLLPDGKTQVSVEYDENDKIVRIDTIVISNQHKEAVSNETLKAGIKKEVIDFCL
jgi:S-adenosylmethionine synthetase